MSRFESWSIHLATLLVGGTGVVYAAMRYLMTGESEFSVVNHPWQPAIQHAHLWFAPLLVFAVGLIWREHVWRHFRSGVRGGRWSGVPMLLTVVPMVASGYLIQTAVSQGWRTAWLGVHLASSALWLAGYAAHALSHYRRKAKLRRTSSVERSEAAA